MPEIRVFNTHIEVFPYKKGDAKNIEKLLSKYDNVSHKYIPIGFYIEDSILYLPRGINLTLLKDTFNAIPTMVNIYDNFERISGGNMKFPPRDRIQEESIDFLTSTGNFVNGNRYNQFGLNLDTGDGKTYCMTNAMLQLKMKGIIITHKQILKEQWMKTILEMSDVSEDRICDISGSEVMEAIMEGKIVADYYYVNHQTLNNYARIHGWRMLHEFFNKIKVGIKIVDEAHKFFENSLMIDFFTNTYKSFYLTATFTRSDPKEVKIFKTAFSSLYRFGEETFDYEEKRKHIVFIVVYFRSHPVNEENLRLNTGYGFSSYKYIDYELNEDYNTLIKVIRRVVKQTENLNGKTLIISPKTESVDTIADKLRDYTDKTVGTVHSKNSSEVNEEGRNSDIISSTIKSIGEGDDIKGLRVLINIDPIGSKALADQLRGRLREYSKEDDTFFFHLVDTSVPESYAFLKRILPVMSRKCKEIIHMRMEDI